MSFITKDDTVLVAIDFQEKLMPAMSNGEETEERAAKLIRGMKVFDIPAIVTQQYTKGIGPTTAKLSAELGDSSTWRKQHSAPCACRNSGKD